MHVHLLRKATVDIELKPTSNSTLQHQHRINKQYHYQRRAARAEASSEPIRRHHSRPHACMVTGRSVSPSGGERNTAKPVNNESIRTQQRRLADAPPPSQRRRLSDSSANPDATLFSRPLAVRSRDGARWLPTPDEQIQHAGRGEWTEVSSEPDEAPLLHQHECSAAVCAVAKAFETTELLESILCFLETKDVLSLRRTNKHWNSTVHSSPYLRLHFFTYPQWERPSSQYKLLPINLPGVAIEEDEPIHLGQWIKVTITPEAAKRICPEPKQRVRSRSIFEGLRGGLGRSSNDAWPASTATPATNGSLKYETLHIAQPPLLGMQAFLVHESSTSESLPTPTTSFAAMSLLGGVPRRHGPTAVAKLSCDSGITLGFLAETAQELLGSQRSGPSSATDVKVVFKAIISFGPADTSPRRSSRRNLRTVTRIG